MPTLITDAERNADADRAASVISHLSLHLFSPGTTGQNEVVGGTPAYARKAVTFTPAGSVGPLGASKQPATVGVAWSTEANFDVPSGSYSHWGAWNSLTAGVYKRGNTLATPQNPTQQTIISLTIGIGPYSGA